MYKVQGLMLRQISIDEDGRISFSVLISNVKAKVKTNSNLIEHASRSPPALGIV